MENSPKLQNSQQRQQWGRGAKATAITADLPSEAELQPAFWGEIEFK